MSDEFDIFRIENNHVKPEKGCILISEPFMNDRYFGRSVVLLVEHDLEHGSMGFVLNKPLDQKVNDYFQGLESIPDIPIFQGGPVGTNRLFFIHTLGDLVPSTTPIGNGLYFDGDFDVIKSYLSKGNPADSVKFFLGYSGWGKNQLENEISCNSWVVSESDKFQMMKNEGEICWKRALSKLGNRYKSWANFPKRPFLN